MTDIPHPPSPGNVPVIVAGIDGSDRSGPVLRWAMRYAATVHGRLHVVLAWQLPDIAYHVPFHVDAGLDEEEIKRVNGLVSEALGSLGIKENEIAIETTVQEGGAVALLLREARDADLLVLGRHGHGHRHDDKLVGSISHSCVAQAPCPVVVVPVNSAAAT